MQKEGWSYRSVIVQCRECAVAACLWLHKLYFCKRDITRNLLRGNKKGPGDTSPLPSGVHGQCTQKLETNVVVDSTEAH